MSYPGYIGHAKRTILPGIHILSQITPQVKNYMVHSVELRMIGGTTFLQLALFILSWISSK